MEHVIDGGKLGKLVVRVIEENGKKFVDIFSEYFDIIAEGQEINETIAFIKDVIKAFSEVLNIIMQGER